MAASSGTALGVDKDAKAEASTETRVLDVGSDIFIGDKVVTDTKGLVEIKFNDDTKLVVGPNSALVIQDYLLRNDNSPGKFAINALNGTFRFVTGKARKDLYQINTPTGTIGVRGTAGDISVTPDLTLVMIYHGAMILCDKSHPPQCVTIDASCEIGQIDPQLSQIIGDADKVNGADRDALKHKFPWAVNESPLQHAFWVANARRCMNVPFSGISDTGNYGTSQGGGPGRGCPQYRSEDIYEGEGCYYGGDY